MVTTGRTGIAAMFIGSGSKLLSWRAEPFQSSVTVFNQLCCYMLFFQKQLFASVLQNSFDGFSEIFCKSYWNTPVMEFFFSEVAGCNLAKGLYHRLFSTNSFFLKHLGTSASVVPLRLMYNLTSVIKAVTVFLHVDGCYCAALQLK